MSGCLFFVDQSIFFQDFCLNLHSGRFPAIFLCLHTVFMRHLGSSKLRTGCLSISMFLDPLAEVNP